MTPYYEAAYETFYKVRHTVTEKIVSNSQSFAQVRTGTDFKNRLLRMGMRTFLHYAPNKLIQKVMIDNLFPDFLNK
mgnify:CR=1 FL=1